MPEYGELDMGEFRGLFKDKYFLLFEQCLRDARRLAGGTWSSKDGDGKELWESAASFEENIGRIACSLFEARRTDPLTSDDIKKLFMGAQLADIKLSDLEKQYQEYLNITRKIKTKKRRLDAIVEKYDQLVMDQRAEQFTRDAMGSANLNLLKERGRIEVVGSNHRTYVLELNGSVSKKGVTGWGGQIVDPPMPMLEAIATVYQHIVSQAKEFDAKKGCGNISLRD